jgi:hypothetical protein
VIAPHTREEWDEYDALPEWEVTARMSRTARFRMHAAGPDEAAAMLREGRNGVRSMQDLHDGDMEVDCIFSVEACGADIGHETGEAH